MTSTLAALWHTTIAKATTLNPRHIEAAIDATIDDGLKAADYEARVSGAAGIPVTEKDQDGNITDEYTLHLTAVERIALGRPGNRSEAALRQAARDTVDVRIAEANFVYSAGIVLDWVSGRTPTNWHQVLELDARLQPGTIQAGIDVDDEYILPRPIRAAGSAVDELERIATAVNAGRDPSDDERLIAVGIPIGDCCRVCIRIRRPVPVQARGLCSTCYHLRRKAAAFLGLSMDDAPDPHPWLVEKLLACGPGEQWSAHTSRWHNDLLRERRKEQSA